jgi:hypothetical protein
LSALKTVCAWCDVLIKDGPPHPVSHGICEPCSARMLAGDSATPPEMRRCKCCKEIKPLNAARWCAECFAVDDMLTDTRYMELVVKFGGQAKETP